MICDESGHLLQEGRFERWQTMFYGEDSRSTNDVIFGFISAYSKRHVTESKDRLPAFLGILGLVAAHSSPVYHLQGVQIVTTNSSYHLQNPAPSWSIEVAFITGMIWNVQTGRRQTREISSWSWAAWSGYVGWGQSFWEGQDRSLVEDLQERNIASVWVEDSKKNVVSLLDYEGYEESLASSNLNVIHIESETFEVGLEYFSEPVPDWYCLEHPSSRYEGINYEKPNIKLSTLPPGHWALWEIPGFSVCAPFNPFTSMVYEDRSSHCIAQKYIVIILVKPGPRNPWPESPESELQKERYCRKSQMGHMKL